MALLGLAGLAFGQGEPLSTMALGPRLADAIDAPATDDAPVLNTAPAAITDDGHRGDELLEARQLIIALRTDRARTIPVQLLNEHGQVVRACTLQAPAGRRALALDVSALARGRYVARIGEAGQVVRFIR
ncbi:MAG TPA: hypothetical protein VHL57_04330 [Flavobacteriales bacterium]|nr:hypothetical protein [Flavobacteriales bacterium]